MRAITLMYHDVVESDEHETSGFPGPDAALYKLGPQQFAAHLAAIADALREPPITLCSLPTAATGRTPVLLTFDDGGASAYARIADMLEARGWQGHFFIAVGQIGRRSFISLEQLRALRRRGHIIGTHSFSHPLRMSQCSWEELVCEWRTSVEILSEILGERVCLASVPGGHYARKIAEAASLAGIEALFTSEPTTRCWRVGRCLVYGRYTVQRWTSPKVAAALASGAGAPRLRQLLFWNTKKLIKALGGEYYLKVRESVLRQE